MPIREHGEGPGIGNSIFCKSLCVFRMLTGYVLILWAGAEFAVVNTCSLLHNLSQNCWHCKRYTPVYSIGYISTCRWSFSINFSGIHCCWNAIQAIWCIHHVFGEHHPSDWAPLRLSLSATSWHLGDSIKSNTLSMCIVKNNSLPTVP